MHEVDIVAAHPIAERSEGREIVANASDEPGEELEGRPHRQHEDKQQQGQYQIGLAQALDALVHPRDHRRKRDGRDARDHQYHGRVGRRHAEQKGQSCHGLLGAQTERGRQPEECGEHGEDIDDVAENAPDRVAQNRIER